jgi:hypothetical protein
MGFPREMTSREVLQEDGSNDNRTNAISEVIINLHTNL